MADIQTTENGLSSSSVFALDLEFVWSEYFVTVDCSGVYARFRDDLSLHVCLNEES